MVKPETTYKLIRQEQAARTFCDQALQRIRIKRQRVVKQLWETDHFTLTGSANGSGAFEEEWSSYWIASGKVLRDSTTFESTQVLNLPEGLVYPLASDLLQRAINGESKEAICNTLKEHQRNIPKDLGWPFRNIFHLVERHLVKGWNREDAGIAPPALRAIDWRILWALPGENQPWIPTSKLIAALEDTKSPVYRSLSKLNELGLVERGRGVGYRLTSYGTRLIL